jgi:hypothetical protein
MLDIQGRKYASVTVCDVTLYDIITNYPVMYFDTLKVNTFEGTAEVTDIQGGKGNSTLASVSHTREINVQFDDAIMTMSSLAVLTGGELREGTDENKIVMMESELIHVKDGDTSIVLSRKARKGSYVYIAEMQDGILSTATRTIDKLGEETNTISINDFYNAREDAFKEATIRVFYEYEKGFPKNPEDLSEISEITVLADKFAGTYRFIGDTVLFNQYSGVNDVFQIEIPKLKLDSSFSLTFNAATEAAVFSFKGKALRNDEGEMIKFRQLRADDGGNGATDDGNGDQYDGQFKRRPAEIVNVDPVSGDISGTGKYYPLNENYEPLNPGSY